MFQAADVSSGRVNLWDRAQKIEIRAEGKRLGRIFVTCEVMIRVPQNAIWRKCARGHASAVSVM